MDVDMPNSAGDVEGAFDREHEYPAVVLNWEKGALRVPSEAADEDPISATM